MIFFIIIFFCIFGGTAMKTGDWDGFFKWLGIFLVVIFILYLFGSCSNTANNTIQDVP